MRKPPPRLKALTFVAAAVLIALDLAGCTAWQIHHPEAPLPPEKAPESETNLQTLKSKLGLEGVSGDLGYREAKFDSCLSEFRVSSEQTCGPRVLAVVRFRLQCRDSEGTVTTALTPTDLQPISMKTVRWALAGRDGEVQTDSEGNAELIGFYLQSPKNQRIRIAVGNDFLHMHADEITRVVVPRSWCQ